MYPLVQSVSQKQITIPNGFITSETKSTTEVDWDKSSDLTFMANSSFPLQKYHYNPYFEITITRENGIVAIGVGIKPKDSKSLPGYDLGSYGYHSNDGYAFSETFCGGDVVGCGVNLQGNVFFTKNGIYLGQIGKVNVQNFIYYPLVGLNNSAVTVNFGSEPFKYDVLTQFAIKNKSTAGLANLPEEVVLAILSRMNISCVCLFSQVYRGIHLVAKSNEVWRPLVFKKWPHACKTLKLNSYFNYYRRRMTAVREFHDSTNRYQLVENCDLGECPILRDKMNEKDGKELCATCRMNIKYAVVATKGELNQYDPVTTFHGDLNPTEEKILQTHKYYATYRKVELEEENDQYYAHLTPRKEY